MGKTFYHKTVFCAFSTFLPVGLGFLDCVETPDVLLAAINVFLALVEQWDTLASTAVHCKGNKNNNRIG